MAITGSFNNVGYNKVSGITGRDLRAAMPDVTRSPYESGFRTTADVSSQYSAFLINDQQAGSVSSMVAGYEDDSETLMDKMRPDVSYEADKVDLAGMTRQVDKGVSDASKVSGNISSAKENVKENVDSFQQDWRSAKSEAVAMLKDVAVENGVDPNQAVQDMCGTHQKSDLGTVALAAAGNIGGGAVMAAGAVIGTKIELSKQEKALPAEKQEALVKETLARLQESRKPIDTRESSNKVVMSDEGKVPEKSQVAWENLQPEKFKEFLAADPDGLDQPEMKELMALDEGLDDVKDNMEAVGRGYGNKVTADKVELALEKGGLDLSEGDMEVDSGAVTYAGESLSWCAGSIRVKDGSVDLDAVQLAKDKMEPPADNQEAIAQQLNRDIQVGIRC